MKLPRSFSITRPAALFTATCVLSTAICAADSPAPPTEKQILSDGSKASQWYPSESSVASADGPSKTGASIVHWHVPVDYHAGEAKYPIGWPRMGLSLKGGITDWTDWDYLHFWIYANTTRSELPRIPVGLSIQQGDSKSDTLSLTLSDLKKNQWLEVQIPISKLAHPNDVRGLQFNIAESNYKDGDQIDFHIDEVALLRYAKPILLEFSAENLVTFTNARVIAADFVFSGIPSGEQKKVTLALIQNGKSVLTGDFVSGRGKNRLALPFSTAEIKPGTYQLTGTPEGGEAVSSQIRIVESPWH